ncbi:MAG: Rieske 2Fe-2S domain-containing protein [Magnetococcales bacterium]|nr:Rieske 2Fe-2S domain-containing protein [Magnetococcales bacterium]
MSKALRYLGGVRPEAATHLLGFYKESVKALDDKTRFLIQIVTKVTVGTERGLRQYAPKALKAGATKDEILDAVLMAFPAAGLNKVLDALEVMIDLELLPEAPGADQAPEVGEQDLGALADFPLKKMECAKTQAGKYIVYRTSADSAQVYASRCPHSKASLCKGVDHGDAVECKVHNWVFDLETGKCLEPDAEDKPGMEALNIDIREGRIILLP